MNNPDPSQSWICESCGAEVDEGFEQCWNCGMWSDGTPDVTVNVQAIIERAEQWDNIRCLCGYVGPFYIAKDRPNFRTTAELVGWLMRSMTGIPFKTIREIRCCPQCDASDSWLPTDEQPSEEAVQMANEAQRRYDQSTSVPLGLALLLAIIGIGYAFWVWAVSQ